MEFDAKTVAAARYGRCMQLLSREKYLKGELGEIYAELERLLVQLPQDEMEAFNALYTQLSTEVDKNAPANP